MSLCRTCGDELAEVGGECRTCDQYRRRHDGEQRPAGLIERARERTMAGEITTRRDGITRETVGKFGRMLDEALAMRPQHPLDGLPEEYARAARMVAVLEVLVGGLEEPLGRNRFDEQVVHPLTALFGEWVDRKTRVAKLALDANIDLRRQQLAEAEMTAIAEAIKAAKQAAGLNPAQEEMFDGALAAGLASTVRAA